jgi:ABC-type multidrug transport system fused ATPase/permease subunit
LTLTGLLAIFILALISMLVSYTEAKKLVIEQNAAKVASDLAEEVLTNIRTTIFYGGQRNELIRYKRELRRDFSKVAKWMGFHSLTLFLSWFATCFAWALMIWYGLALVLLTQDCSSASTPYYFYDAGDVTIVI